MEDERAVFLTFGTTCFRINNQSFSLSGLKQFLKDSQGITEEHLYFTHNGKILSENDSIFYKQSREQDFIHFIHSHLRVLGGKGGFGSMLRALGAQIEKTTNREACRDLSGRRMRDVNNEKKIGEWLEKQKQEDEEKEQRKKEKLERILNPPRHIVKDSSYVNEIKENANKVDSALKQGLETMTKSDEASSTKSKRRGQTSDVIKHKKRKMWLGLEDSCSSDESEDGEELISLDNIVSPVEVIRKAEETKTSEPIEYTNTSKCEKAEISLKSDLIEMEFERKSENLDNQDLKEEENKTDMDCQIDLGNFTMAAELEALGLERLKVELMRNGLKCGGTLQQRAQRLFLLKDKSIDQLDSSVFAKPSNKKSKSNEK